MDKLHRITRRTAIIGAVTSSAALAVPAAASLPTHGAAADARLFSLIEEWRRQYDACATAPDEARIEAAFSRLYSLDKRIAAIRPATVEGFAAKLLILTSFGEFDFDGPAAGLLAEAEAISGVAPPATFNRQIGEA